VECQRSRIEKRIETRYLDIATDSLDEALALIAKAVKEKSRCRSVWSAMRRKSFPKLVRRRVKPDAVTDQTSAHDVVNGYLPEGWTVAEWETKRTTQPDAVAAAARKSIAKHVRAMLAFASQGIPTFDYGNNIRQVAKDEGVENAFDFPGFVPAYIRPLFCRGIGPFRLGGAVRRSRGYFSKPTKR